MKKFESITNMKSQSGGAHVYRSIIKSVAQKWNVLVEEGEEVVFRDVLIVEGENGFESTKTNSNVCGREEEGHEEVGLEAQVYELSHT